MSAEPIPARQPLAPPAPISQSPLWKIQEDYYRAQGVAAWDDQVPFLITNSAATAQVYAELILAFVRDLGPDPQGRPITILEVGTGLGRLGFLLCRELERQREYFAASRQQKFRLVLSDIAKDNVRFWEGHHALTPYIEAGWLDFACFNPVQDTSLRLRRSGELIAPGTLELPLVVLANYFFDALPHDEFLIRDGQLYECQIEVLKAHKTRYSSAERTDIRDVLCQRTYHPTTTAHYSNPTWNRLLADYQQTLPAGAVTIPVGGLTTLDRLRALSPAGLMPLSSDRGYTTPEAMAAYGHHDYDTHRGCFSHFVNFDALGRTFQRYLSTTYASTEGVQTMVGVSLAQGPRAWENLEFSFHEHLTRVSRINSASQSLTLLRPQRSSLDEARALVAFLRQNLCDSHTVATCAGRLLEGAHHLQWEDRQDLASLLDEAWNSFYDFPGAVRLPQILGHLYRVLERDERAVECFDRALVLRGEVPSLHMFRAACLQRLGRLEEARGAHQNAVRLDPSLADLDPATAP